MPIVDPGHDPEDLLRYVLSNQAFIMKQMATLAHDGLMDARVSLKEKSDEIELFLAPPKGKEPPF